MSGERDERTPETASRVLALIRGGEGPLIEFKSSLRWDYRNSKVNKELAKVVAKTIAAFMNSAGGTLLIGVDDDGALLGLGPDFATLAKKNRDGFELALRDVFVSYLGADVDSVVSVEIVAVEGFDIAVVTCAPHVSPVYVTVERTREFWVRSGNSTRSLDPAAAVSYVNGHWRSPLQVAEDRLRAILAEEFGRRHSTATVADTRPDRLPNWLHLSTRRVIDLFLSNLARAHGWKRINIISPWISDINGPLASLSLDQLLRRLKDEQTTVYLVTRPPTEKWHEEALSKFADSERANIALLPELHVKLFTAQTAASSFAMLGSANFTTQSLTNREIGVLISATGDGRAMVRELEYEAAEIYRHRDRQLVRQARL